MTWIGCTSDSNAGGGSSGGGGTGGGCSNSCPSTGTRCLSSSSLETCAATSGGCLAATTRTCATNLVCERYAPAACADPQWVAWPMPNGKDDVDDGAPNQMSFTDNGDGTVTDDVTRLMWQQVVPTATSEWAAAGSYCQDLVLAGHSDWRLPSLVELISIADLGKSDPSIDVAVFPSTPASDFWSSTVWGTSPSTVATVTFARGNTRQEPMVGSPHHVRCVR
jgi:hypothetical protein